MEKKKINMSICLYLYFELINIFICNFKIEWFYKIIPIFNVFIFIFIYSFFIILLLYYYY